MSKIDTQSETWRAMQEHAQSAALDEMTALMVHGTAIERTEYHRGRLAAFNEMLALAKPEGTPVAVHSPDYGLGTRIDT